MSNLSIAPYFAFARTKITGQFISNDRSEAWVSAEPDLRYKALCHTCGTPAQTTHSHEIRTIRDLDVGETRIHLRSAYRNIVCPQCDGVRTEALEYVEGCKRLTKRFARYVYSLCKILTVKEVADHLGLDRKTVKDIDKTFLEKEFGATDYTGLRILAIDEIAVRRGHRYLTVVLDYETGRVVWMGRDRNKETLSPFFQGMTETQRAQIQAVALDMWDPYINCIRRWCPEAKIVFDLFHIVKEFNKAIDAVRNREYRTASEEDRRILKGSKYLLLKNGENLKPEEASKLDKLLNLNGNLATMYILKDYLKELWACSSRSQVLVALTEWCRITEESNIPEAKSFAKRLCNYCYGILNHAEYPISSGRLEGTNNKIKVIKRRSYGFHDIDYFILKIKQAFPGKNNQLFGT